MSRREEKKCFLFLPVLIEHGMMGTSAVFELYNPSFLLQDQSCTFPMTSVSVDAFTESSKEKNNCIIVYRCGSHASAPRTAMAEAR